MTKYDINNPKMTDSIALDLAFHGHLENRLPKKFTYKYIYDTLTSGGSVEINKRYVDKMIQLLNERIVLTKRQKLMYLTKENGRAVSIRALPIIV